jgi:hypothetical protein
VGTGVEGDGQQRCHMHVGKVRKARTLGVAGDQVVMRVVNAQVRVAGQSKNVCDQ